MEHAVVTPLERRDGDGATIARPCDAIGVAPTKHRHGASRPLEAAATSPGIAHDLRVGPTPSSFPILVGAIAPERINNVVAAGQARPEFIGELFFKEKLARISLLELIDDFACDLRQYAVRQLY